MNQTKICTKCKQEKDINEFCKRKVSKDGLNYKCKDCVTIYQLINKDPIKIRRTEHYHENIDVFREKARKQRLKNPEIFKQINHNWYINNIERVKQRKIQYLIEDPEYFKKINKRYHLKNSEKCKLHQKNSHTKYKDKINFRRRERRKTDVEYKILENLRCRIRGILLGYSKSAHTLVLIMCSIPELKLHIESLWLPGMSWANYGYGVDKWHIDHIIPCSFFNMLDPVEQYMCFRWQNLQPLWQTDNFKKGNKIVK